MILIFICLIICGCKNKEDETPVLDSNRNVWKDSVAIKDSDGWAIASKKIDNEFGTYLGNGRFGIRLFAEGVGNIFNTSNMPTESYMSDMYLNEKIVNAPQIGDIRFLVRKGKDYINFELDEKKKDYIQTLNIKDAKLNTDSSWVAGNKRAKINTDFYVLRMEKSHVNSVIVKIEIIPNFNGDMALYAPVTYDIKSFKNDIDIYTLGDNKYKIFQAFSGNNNKNNYIPNEVLQSASYTFKVKKGKKKSIYYYAGILNQKYEKPGVNDFLIDSKSKKSDYEKCISLHKKNWAQLWKSDIQIDGDPISQQVIRTNMFYLLSSASEDASIPPMGWSSNAFDGHVFWDAELWMFPALIWQHPQLAKGIIKYRINTLKGAMDNASKNGMQGAEYAWESGVSGNEDTPSGVETRNERHINGDIAFAIWQYYIASGDRAFLSECYEVLKGTADYWVSRSAYNKNTGLYDINGVCPPDETAGIVNNSVFTNAVARINLTIAAEASKILGKSLNPKWSELANKINMPYDKSVNRFLIYDGYANDTIKQADPELLLYPLKYQDYEKSYLKSSSKFNNETYVNTYDFYRDKVIAVGPAMSASAHTVISARLSREKEAYDYFKDSYIPFMRGEYNYFNEKRSKTYTNWCFLTGAGSSVAAVLWGFCGLDMDYYNINTPFGQKQSINPHLPNVWKSVVLKNVCYNGKRCDIFIDHKTNKIIKKY